MFKKMRSAVKAATAKAVPSAAGAASSAPAKMSGGMGGFAKMLRSPQFKEAVQKAIQNPPAGGAAPAVKKRGMGLFGKVSKAAMPAMKMKSGGMADKAGRAMKKTAADARGRAMKKGK